VRIHANHFALPVRTGSRVAAVRRHAGGLVVELTGGEQLTTREAIAATGLFGAPQVPALPGMETYNGELLHTAADRRPDTYTGQRVVVGGGNSAIQIAVELAQVAEVSLATRSPLKTRRQRPLGIDHWLHYSGIDRLPLGRRAAASVGVLDDGQYTAALAAGRPQQRDMFTTIGADGVRWPDGHEERIDTVILGTATGRRPTSCRRRRSRRTAGSHTVAASAAPCVASATSACLSRWASRPRCSAESVQTPSTSSGSSSDS
jgi:putative flavoprotein involved in K+ transport